MTRRFFIFLLVFVAVGIAMITMLTGNQNVSKAQAQYTLTITPIGPNQTTIDNIKTGLMNNAAVKQGLKGQSRILSFELLDRIENGDSLPPDRWRAYIYSYGNKRAFLTEGNFTDSNITVTTVSGQLDFTSAEEFDDATSVVSSDPKFSGAFRAGSVRAYPPMPPTSADPQGKGDRIVNVGILGGSINQIVGVDMNTRKLVYYKNNAPTTAIATPSSCGIPGAGQATTARGTAGQFEVVVTDGTTEIWRMVVIRPSASSGTRASGVELRNVDYRSKRMLGRAHVPILNVLYDGNRCGPYRDWQWQEGMFTANGTDVATGVRQCTSVPQSFLQTNNDTGNFRGAAFYVEPATGELTIMSEMEAGWYRYISEWHLFNNGTLQPRFGFGGVFNSCICNTHNHHAYFRLDFDIAGTSPNVVSGPALRSWPNPIATELKIIRQGTIDDRLLIKNPATGDTVMLTPALTDGIADSYAVGDMWVLRGKGTSELDDGYNSTGGSGTFAQLDNFVNSESVSGQDIVVWYRGGFRHIFNDGDAAPHYVGPEISVVQW
ncbi:MAG: hypothetical protein AB1757_11860 [Acidobacteriota bacterium]